MRTIFNTIAVSGAVVFFLLMAAPSGAEPPRWVQADKHYAYHYYPASQVYYAPECRTYFWHRDGAWHFGTTNPTGIQMKTIQPEIMSHEAEEPRERVYELRDSKL